MRRTQVCRKHKHEAPASVSCDGHRFAGNTSTTRQRVCHTTDTGLPETQARRASECVHWTHLLALRACRGVQGRTYTAGIRPPAGLPLSKRCSRAAREAGGGAFSPPPPARLRRRRSAPYGHYPGLMARAFHSRDVFAACGGKDIAGVPTGLAVCRFVPPPAAAEQTGNKRGCEVVRMVSRGKETPGYGANRLRRIARISGRWCAACGSRNRTVTSDFWIGGGRKE